MVETDQTTIIATATSGGYWTINIAADGPPLRELGTEIYALMVKWRARPVGCGHAGRMLRQLPETW
jgi:hypothetical protein